jgi:hypothetical protein
MQVTQLMKTAMDVAPKSEQALWKKAFEAKVERAKPALDDFMLAWERSGPLVVRFSQGNPNTFGSGIVEMLADGIGCLLMDFQISLENLSTASPLFTSPARGYLNGDGTPPDMLAIPCKINDEPTFHLDTISLVEQMFVGIGTKNIGDNFHSDLRNFADDTPPHNKAPRRDGRYVQLAKYEQTAQLLDEFFQEFWREPDWLTRGSWRNHFRMIEMRYGEELMDPKELRKMKVRYQRDMIMCCIFYHALEDLMYSKDETKLHCCCVGVSYKLY